MKWPPDKAKELTMEKELFNFVAQRVDILSKADTSKQETIKAAHAWQEAVAADASKADAATNTLLDYLMGRLITVDQVIAFAEGPAKELFGEEGAAAMLAEQKQRKEAGAKYCNCEAHTAATELLAKFGRIEL